jgi:hypothetical protein
MPRILFSQFDHGFFGLRLFQRELGSVRMLEFSLQLCLPHLLEQSHKFELDGTCQRYVHAQTKSNKQSERL